MENKKRRTWLWILGWILIFPIPLTILLRRNEKMKKGIKLLLIALAWLLYLVIIGSNTNKSQESFENSTNTSVETTESVTQSETTSPVEEQTVITETTEVVTQLETVCDTEETITTKETVNTTIVETTEIITEEVKTEPQISETLSQKNALRSAKNYLEFTNFSYEGLIQQLEFEQYPHDDAVYAADNCGADWFEQAVGTAKNYMNLMPMSKDELINQLEFEKYTHEQAEYAAQAIGY